MKIIYIFLIIVWSFDVKSQENEYCRLNIDKLNELYETYENNYKSKEVVFYVSVKSVDKLKKIYNWASNNGYETEFSYETNVDTALRLKKKVDVFSFYIYKTIYLDIEQLLNSIDSSCFAIKIDTCIGSKQEDILQVYKRCIDKNEILYFYQSILFDAGKESNISKLQQWAEENGYKTKIDVMEFTSIDDGQIKKYDKLLFEKKIATCNLDFFTNEINMTTAAMKKLKICHCSSTGQGVVGHSNTN